MKFDTKPASDYPLTDLLRIANFSFEDYFVPIHLDNSQFLTLLRKDSVDITSSRVLLADGDPAGISLIARRGWSSRLAMMGIKKEVRGQGAGTEFMEVLIREACERKDREMVLEVIEQNEPGVRLYRKYGFETIRRLIGLVYQDAKQDANNLLEEIDLRELGRLISQHGMPDLPWQLSGETIALLSPPSRAYKKGDAYIAVSNPEAEHVVIWSLLVEPSGRGKGHSMDMLRNVMAHHPGRTWHVPALWPEELGNIFEQVGFKRQDISQRQMRLSLNGR